MECLSGALRDASRGACRLPRGTLYEDVISVSFAIKNTASRDGAEVPQLYLTFPPAAREPPRQLKGFVKTFINANQSREVELGLRRRDVSIWENGDWKIINGLYSLEIGSSSADIRLNTNLELRD